MALIDKLNAIGDAVRSKTGGTELIPLDAMPAAIESIQTGGGESVNKLPEYFSSANLTLAEEDFAGLTYLRSCALAGAYFESVSIPDTVTDYGNYLFYQSDIGSLKLSANASTISNYMFNMARFANKLVLPEVITSIGARAFMKATVSIQLPSKLKTIEAYAFSSSDLDTVTIPASVETIESYAFGNCYDLKTVTFEGTPTTLNANTFKGSAVITDIYVPWAEGTVANAPWGAPTRATIHYEYQGGNT